MRGVKKWLDTCEKKDHEKYLEVKHRYEELANILEKLVIAFKKLLSDDDLERKLRNLNELIIEMETWNMSVRELHRDQVNVAEIILALIAGAAVAVGGAAVVVAGTAAGVAGGGVGVVGGAVAGAGVGAAVGLIGGPAGVAVGGVVGGAVGAVAGGVVGAVASLFGWWK